MKHIPMKSICRKNEEIAYENIEQCTLKYAMNPYEFCSICDKTIQDMDVVKKEIESIFSQWWNLNIEHHFKLYMIVSFKLFTTSIGFAEFYITKVKETIKNREDSYQYAAISGIDVDYIMSLNEISNMILLLSHKMNFCLCEISEGNELHEINEVLAEEHEIARIFLVAIEEMYECFPELDETVKRDGLNAAFKMVLMAA